MARTKRAESAPGVERFAPPEHRLQWPEGFRWQALAADSSQRTADSSQPVPDSSLLVPDSSLL
jgi:hypothetical protein